MRSVALVTVLSLGLWGLWVFGAPAEPSEPSKPVRKTTGIDKRIPWTTSKMFGSPEPPPPYRTAQAFPKLKFNEPLDLVFAPGTDRFFVAERWGKLYSFVNRQDVEKADLVLELKGRDEKGAEVKQVIYGLAFHPKFKDNGFVYVSYIPDQSKETPTGSRVARFQVQGNPPRIDRASEKVIFEWPSGGHNGGCLQFGPDGYLYLGTGDGSGIADELQIGQDLSTPLGKILRIDVDRPEQGKGYGIPKDNPFIGHKGARPEVWAYGLRQPWRFSFDRVTGELWCGEVGQDLWEMVYKIQKGGNYGWSVQEGRYPFRPERKKGPTPILPPVLEHPHSDFRSLTGGFVYRGTRLKELVGQYIYGDFDTGRIWAYQEGKAKEAQRELARTTYRLVSFGEDAQGELYFVDFMGGGFHQLIPAPASVKAPPPFPRKLSETGLFASTAEHRIAPGVIPYSVNGQLWGDHAFKERFLAIPNNAQIGFDEITYPQPSPGAPPGWRFPDGTVLVKTFAMEMERGNPRTRKRLETRLLHFQQFPGTQEVGDQYWRGYTYVWNEGQTDAYLLEDAGKDVVLNIKVDGKQIAQKYRFPSRAECALCHTNASKFALGVNTMQMNREHNYDGVIANQLATLEHIGLFSNKLPNRPEKLPRLADYDDARESTEVRARAYLHSNCSHCHMKWGGGNAEFKLLSTLSTKDMGIVDVAPAHGNFGIANAKLITPGRPDLSIIPNRMARVGLGRMPHIGSHVPDEKAVRLIEEWIRGMR